MGAGGQHKWLLWGRGEAAARYSLGGSLDHLPVTASRWVGGAGYLGNTLISMLTLFC